MLTIVEARTSQANIDRGVAAAQAFFDKHSIIPHLVYTHVLAEAEGDPHVSEFVELWEQAHCIAISETYRNEEPVTIPVLIYLNK